ncbi:hypothetical protein VitviT2T_016908 [Vitis vinifera]|uniref:LRR receptor-like serine/threonine-protein kinase n=1 Tax=Vitis vinifera TaxID=29760 RepID=A0ABY9CUL9_VITVI|nr:hypothetical protein VitviT2T_016908 [Vitis vinifera]
MASKPVTTSPYVLLSNLYASDGKWENLKNLSLADNNFPGSISDSISGHNQLMRSLVSGGGPLELANMKVSDLSYIQLSGKLPGFNFLYALEVLKPSNNRFAESIPNNLLKGDPLVLIELDLSQQFFRADKHDHIYNFEHP